MRAKVSDAEMTGRIRAALRANYADRTRYCFLEEVGNATGFENRGWADAFVFHLWPSDGLRFDGFEIKASKNDWKKELKNPQKSENIARFCDAWYVVAPKGIIEVDTVPAGWGFWEYDAEQDVLRPRLHPVRRKQLKYIPRQFFASLLRRTQDTLPSVEYLARHYTEARRSAEREVESRLRATKSSLEKSEARNEKILAQLRAHGFEWNSWREEIMRKVPA